MDPHTGNAERAIEWAGASSLRSRIEGVQPEPGPVIDEIGRLSLQVHERIVRREGVGSLGCSMDFFE